MNKPAMEALLEAKKALLRSGKRSPLVFPGRKEFIGDIRDGLNHACDRAGIPRVTIHQLRHTCASQMVMAGADLPSVAAALGHKDITTTMIYAHLTQTHVREQMGRLDAIPIPESCPKSAPCDNFVGQKVKKGTRLKPDSLSVSEWCRRRDLNPHGSPHHPLKMACLPVPPLRRAAERNIVSTLRSKINMESSASGRRASGFHSATSGGTFFFQNRPHPCTLFRVILYLNGGRSWRKKKRRVAAACTGT